MLIQMAISPSVQGWSAMRQIYVLEPIRLAPGEKPVPSILGSDFLDSYNLVITKGRERIIITDEDLDV